MEKIEPNLPIERSASKIRYYVEEFILILLLVLSLVGIGLTNFSAADGWWYWMIMIFVFAFCAIITGFFRMREASQTIMELLVVQMIHWLGVMAAVVAAFSLLNAGVMEEQATGLVILLILALATFLDGVRIGWRFSLVGIFLGVTAVIVAHVEEYLVLVMSLAVVIVIVTLVFGKKNTRAG